MTNLVPLANSPAENLIYMAGMHSEQGRYTLLCLVQRQLTSYSSYIFLRQFRWRPSYRAIENTGGVPQISLVRSYLQITKYIIARITIQMVYLFRWHQRTNKSGCYSSMHKDVYFPSESNTQIPAPISLKSQDTPCSGISHFPKVISFIKRIAGYSAPFHKGIIA